MTGCYMIAVLQVCIAGTMAYPYFVKERAVTIYDPRRTLVAIFLPFGLLFCFFLEAAAGHVFFSPVGFREFGWLTFVSAMFMWLARIRYFQSNPTTRFVSELMLGILIWLSVFVQIRLIPAAILVLFPVLGMLWFVPFFTLIHSWWILRKSNLNTGRSLAYGLTFILIFQLLMNLWVPEPFAWFHLFNPFEKYRF